MSSRQYIYHMEHLSKTFGGGKEILKKIHLSFYPDAKIGVVGVNGSGKSTLLKIMAGLDQEFNGEAYPANWARVGYLAQEPELDPTKTALGNVLEGVAEAKALLDRFEAVSMKFGEPLDDDEMNAVIAEQADIQERIDALDA